MTCNITLYCFLSVNVLYTKGTEVSGFLVKLSELLNILGTDATCKWESLVLKDCGVLFDFNDAVTSSEPCNILYELSKCFKSHLDKQNCNKAHNEMLNVIKTKFKQCSGIELRSKRDARAAGARKGDRSWRTALTRRRTAAISGGRVKKSGQRSIKTNVSPVFLHRLIASIIVRMAWRSIISHPP